jgi:hypothetical protein
MDGNSSCCGVKPIIENTFQFKGLDLFKEPASVHKLGNGSHGVAFELLHIIAVQEEES